VAKSICWRSTRPLLTTKSLQNQNQRQRSPGRLAPGSIKFEDMAACAKPSSGKRADAGNGLAAGCTGRADWGWGFSSY
jgi:hypothetical protein